MLKKKFAIIVLLIACIIYTTKPIVKADDEEKNQNDEENLQIELLDQNDSEEYESHNDAISSDLEKNDVYIIDAGDIIIDYPIDGNLFVIANSVTINSQIGGDAFICANKLTVDSQGYIFSNLFSCCNELNINGIIYDLYNCSQNTSITGYIYRDIHTATNTFNLDGTIGRNAYISAENINFNISENDSNDSEEISTNNATMIYGDLHFESKDNIDIPDGLIGGNIIHSDTSSNTLVNYIWNLGIFVANVLIIWLLMLWLAPKFLSKADYLVSKKVLPSLGFGLLATITIIVSSIVLLVIGLTSEVALLGISLLMLLLGISLPVFTIGLSKFICKKLKNEKILVTLGVLILTSIVIWATTLVPFIGGIINLIIKFIGLGIIVNYVLQARKNKENSNDNSNIITEIIEEKK